MEDNPSFQFEQLYSEWIKSLHKKGLTPNTVSTYEQGLKRFLFFLEKAKWPFERIRAIGGHTSRFSVFEASIRVGLAVVSREDHL